MKKVLLLGFLFCLASQLTAQVVLQYTGQSQKPLFLAAAGSTTLIDFEGIIPTGQSSIIFPGGFTVSGAHFVDINPSFTVGGTQDSFIEVAQGSPLIGAAGTDVLYSLNDNTETVFTTQITLPLNGVLAFATDIKFNDPTPFFSATYFVQLFSVSGPLGPPRATELFTNATYNTFGFIGFTSDTPITSVQIGMATGATGPDPHVLLDNVLFSEPVPEPAAYASFALGASLLLWVTRKRRI